MSLQGIISLMMIKLNVKLTKSKLDLLAGLRRHVFAFVDVEGIMLQTDILIRIIEGVCFPSE